jgi:hypothetical protein
MNSMAEKPLIAYITPGRQYGFEKIKSPGKDCAARAVVLIQD